MKDLIDLPETTNVLKGYDYISFALVFGSAGRGSSEPFNSLSDVDIGIYTSTEIPLLEMGRLIMALEKIVKRKVDLVVLNDLYKRKPNFAFQVIKTSKLLFAKEEDTFVDFKRNVFLYYLDVKPMLDMMKKAMENRIQTNSFGERNYA